MNFSGEDFAESVEVGIDAILGEAEKPNKNGRPTINDDLLLMSRNQWRAFFEQCWPEIGWPLSQIRKRRNSTVNDIQKIFRAVDGKPHCDYARAFLRGEPQEITVATLRKNTIKSSKFRHELQEMMRKLPELRRACAEAKNAFRQSGANDKHKIKQERCLRLSTLRQHKKQFAARQHECLALEKQIREGEVYLYCSELLNLLLSKGKRKRALTPLNLANALAGLPYMRWRQSETRCSKMQADRFAQQPYAVFQLVERMLRRIESKHAKLLVDAFRAELLRLPRKETYPRDSICAQWRDFRLAVEETAKSKHTHGFMPYAITFAFLRNVSRQKTPVDSVLDAQEKIGGCANKIIALSQPQA